MVRTAAKFFIRIYRRFISPITPGNCRYYPSCSEYALIQFDTRPWWVAFPLSLLRILRCNQLFPGGFDYPKKHFSGYKAPPLVPPVLFGWKETAFFLVPDGEGRVDIIRRFKESQ